MKIGAAIAASKADFKTVIIIECFKFFSCRLISSTHRHTATYVRNPAIEGASISGQEQINPQPVDYKRPYVARGSER